MARSFRARFCAMIFCCVSLDNVTDLHSEPSRLRRHGMSPMATLGHKRTFKSSNAMSALLPKADIHQRDHDVRFAPKTDIQAGIGYGCWWARVLKFVEHHHETSP